MSQATEESATCYICGEVFHGADIHAHMRETFARTNTGVQLRGEIINVCRWHTTQ